MTSRFWTLVLSSWLDNNVYPPDVVSDVLWNNRSIRHQGNVLFFPDWVKGNILVVKDVLNDLNMCLSFEEICLKIGYSPSRLLEYNVVCSAVRSFLKAHNIIILIVLCMRIYHCFVAKV